MSSNLQKRKQLINLILTWAIFGGAIGGLIGFSIGYPAVTAIITIFVLTALQLVTTETKPQGQLPSLWIRLFTSTLFGAALGVLIGFVANVLVIAIVLGVGAGLATIGPRKMLVGTLVGIIIGLIAKKFYPDINHAVLGGLTILICRLLFIGLFPKSAALQLTAEQVSEEEARYVVPFLAHNKYVGTGYIQSLAEEHGGSYSRNFDGIGIVESLAELRGPYFNPDLVHPLVREFYEHTSRFKLAIIPEWVMWMKPFFWIFKNTVAERIGQANLPFNQQEAQRGIVSYIDKIEFKDPAKRFKTLRGWIRAFEATGEAIYVGIYTVVRDEDVGYVSVGFPLPDANFTATLIPSNYHGDELFLTSHDPRHIFPGHYLTGTDIEGKLYILRMPTFSEEIHVYVEDGHLKTDHRFLLNQITFLTLHYTIEPMV